MVNPSKETNNYDVCRMRRYTQNILQWNKNDIKGMRMTTGDYFLAIATDATYISGQEKQN